MCPAHARSRVTTFGTVKHSRGQQNKKRTLPFSDRTPAFPMYWPAYYFCPPLPTFFCFIPRCFQPLFFPLLSFSLLFWLLCDWLALSLLQSCLPTLHPFMLCAWPKTNVPPRTELPQLTALTHAPWPPHHSTGNHPPLWMICSSPLYLDSSLFLSYAACSSLLLKMVAPQSLFTLFGMLLLAISLFCLNIVNFISVVLFSLSFIILRVSY